MEEMDMEITLKVIVIGNGNCGKTSLINRFVRGQISDTHRKTIGTDFMEKEFTVPSTGDSVKLMLWDTAGQEMFSKLTRSYYKGSGAVIYVFSTIDRESFLEIERWKQKVESECGDEIVSVLVQNKIDLLEQAAMSKEEVEDLARRLSLKLYRICVKDNVLVNEVFEYVSEEFVRNGAKTAEINDDDEHNHNNDNHGKQFNNYDKTDENNHNNNNGNEKNKTINNANSNSLNSSISSPTNQHRRTGSTTGGGSSGGTFQLQPLTVRTGGKKKQQCTIL